MCWKPCQHLSLCLLSFSFGLNTWRADLLARRVQGNQDHLDIVIVAEQLLSCVTFISIKFNRNRCRILQLRLPSIHLSTVAKDVINCVTDIWYTFPYFQQRPFQLCTDGPVDQECGALRGPALASVSSVTTAHRRQKIRLKRNLCTTS